MEWLPIIIGGLAVVISLLTLGHTLMERGRTKLREAESAARTAGIIEATIGASIRDQSSRIARLEKNFSESEAAVIEERLRQIDQEIVRVWERLKADDRRFSHQKHTKIDPYILEVAKLRVKVDVLWSMNKHNGD